ncbi:MAG: hypothetical protein DRN96_08825, partial [Thermoproteota archaeon]
VGFRRFILDLAQSLKVVGWVRNNPDGSVEAFIQGEDEAVIKLLRGVESPPYPAEVTRMEVEEAEVDPELTQFKVVYGELAEELQEGFGAMHAVFLAYWREFRDYRKEFRDFREEFRDFRREFRDFRREFREFAGRTDKNFKVVLERYGEISRKLDEVIDALKQGRRGGESA